MAKRVTFLIGPDGKVAAVDRKVNARGHAQDVLAWLDAFKSNKVELDKPVAPFTLPDAAEKSVTIGDWAEGDTKATVVLFVGTECSVVRAYAPRIKALAEGYAAKGVRVVGINANAGEKPARMAVGAKAYGWEFPVLKDATNAIGDRFGATKTPEAFVVDASGILRYHGRIDDNAQEADVKSRDLQNALDAILAGQPVTTKQTAVDGCGIRKGPPKYRATVVGTKGVSTAGIYGHGVPVKGVVPTADKYMGYEATAVEIVKFFKTKVPPVSAEETTELFAFMEAAEESKRQNGAPVKLEAVLAKARKK